MGHPWPAQLSRLPAAHPPPRRLRSAWRLYVAFGGVWAIAHEDQNQNLKRNIFPVAVRLAGVGVFKIAIAIAIAIAGRPDCYGIFGIAPANGNCADHNVCGCIATKCCNCV